MSATGNIGMAEGGVLPALRSGVAVDVGSWLIAFCTMVSLAFGVLFFEELTTSRLFLVLLALLAWHVTLCPWLSMTRETWLYGAFVAWLCIALLWSPDVELALNTMFPATDFLLTMILVGSLLAFHNLRAVFSGMIWGLLAASAVHTLVTGFPLGIPSGFSYNGVAVCYVFGLFLVVIYGCMTHARVFATFLALLMLLHVAATTSIKANLGIAFGAMVAALVYLPVATRLMRRNALLIALGLGALGYLVATTPSVVERLSYAVERVSVGIKVLESREDVQGYSGFNERNEWMRQGLGEMKRNPVFGHGVEAYRYRWGVTSHSSAVDLLYNVGIIGCGLFYAAFAALGLRLLARPRGVSAAAAATVLATLLCFMSMTMSGTIFYLPLLGAFLAIGARVLQPQHETRAGARRT